MKTKISITTLLLLLFTTISFAQNSGDSINFTDAKGLKQGKWIKKHSNGQPKYIGQFKNNIPTDTFHYYTNMGKLEAVMVYKNKEKVFSIQYHLSGKVSGLGIYIDQKKDSTWKYYNETGIITAEENYKDFKNNGVWKTYYPSEKIYEEVSWKDGVQHGSWKQFFENGNLKLEAVYKNGKMEGLLKTYYLEGKIKNTTNYKGGISNGEKIEYDENGVITSKEIYTNGVSTKKIK